MNENLYVQFEVSISDQEYYGGHRKSAEMRMILPRDILESLNPGNIFDGMISAALNEFDKPEESDD